MGFVKSLLQSRKFWLMIGAVVTAVLNNQTDLIPAIIMAEIGAISLEDAAHKLGLHWKQPEE